MNGERAILSLGEQGNLCVSPVIWKSLYMSTNPTALTVCAPRNTNGPNVPTPMCRGDTEMHDTRQCSESDLLQTITPTLAFSSAGHRLSATLSRVYDQCCVLSDSPTFIVTFKEFHLDLSDDSVRRGEATVRRRRPTLPAQRSLSPATSTDGPSQTPATVMNAWHKRGQNERISRCMWALRG